MNLLDDLTHIIRTRPQSVVFIVGTGVSRGALAGTELEPLTTWEGLLRSGLRRIHELGKLTEDELTEDERRLGRPRLVDLLGIADLVAQELGAPTGGEFRRWLRETVGAFDKSIQERGVLDALAEHQRRGVMLATTNFDLLLEAVTGLEPVTWRDWASVERAIRGDEPQIVHLHGVWKRTESVILGTRSYDEVVRDPHAQSVLATLRTGRTFVFVGCGAGLRDLNIGAFLNWTATVFAGSEYRHFRLCLQSEVELLRREHPDEQRIFPLAYGAAHSDLAQFLRALLPTSQHAPVP